MKDPFEDLLVSGSHADYTSAVARQRTRLEAEIAALRQRARIAENKLARRRQPTPRRHLIIPDSHASPDEPNDRYRWLGKMIADLQPEVVVELGDFADMPSLCAYDKDRSDFHGRRYRADIDCAVQARDWLTTPIQKAAGYKPRLYALMGNHEERIRKALTRDLVQLEGLISLADLRIGQFGWEEVGFLEPLVIDEICYRHYHVSGVMARPIGGIHQANGILNKCLMSAVQGHTHTYDYKVATRADGAKRFGMVAGCYFTHDPEFAGPAADLYWRGVVLLKDVVEGYGEVERFSIDEIQRRWG